MPSRSAGSKKQCTQRTKASQRYAPPHGDTTYLEEVSVDPGTNRVYVDAAKLFLGYAVLAGKPLRTFKQQDDALV